MFSKMCLVAMLPVLGASMTCAQPGLPCGYQQQCVRRLRPIIETPGGPVDGVNGTFTLSEVPDNGQVQLFDNGVEYPQGRAFRVTAQTLSISPSLVPHKGDVIRIAYQTASPAPSGDARTAVPDTDHNDIVLRQSLLQALMREAVPAAGPEQSEERTPSLIESKLRTPQRALGSISMLSRKMDGRQKRKGNGADEPALLTGFEGIGDSAVPTQYAGELQGNSTPAAGRRVVSTAVTPTPHTSTPRALIMLQQRLATADQLEEQAK